MRTFGIRLIGTAFLALVFIGLAFMAFQSFEPQETSHRPEPQRETEGLAKADSSNAPQKRSSVYYAAITDRPVFSQTRRPADTLVEEVVTEIEPAPQPEPQTAKLPTVNLLGLMDGTDKPRALLSVEGATPLWLSVGQTAGPWTLTEAGPNWLEITADDQKIRLELFK